MKVVDLINSNQHTAFSFEVLPPLKGTGIEKLYATIDLLREFDPKYINITTHRSEYVYQELGNGLYQRKRLRRRPGTVAVAAAIQNKYGLTTVPHLLCSGFTREDTEYVLLDLQFLGITDLLVLRGDKAKHEVCFVPEEGGFSHAIELEEQINRFNQGIFEDGSPMTVTRTPFSYGVACYPEKHEEAPNLESDLMWLKQKVDAGAQYAVTQLFYDNSPTEHHPQNIQSGHPAGTGRGSGALQERRRGEAGGHRMVCGAVPRANGSWRTESSLLFRGG